jgi:hypothetical protein
MGYPDVPLPRTWPSLATTSAFTADVPRSMPNNAMPLIIPVHGRAERLMDGIAIETTGQSCKISATMRITFLALGSIGDILPYATVARAMRDAGYQPTFVTTENYQPLLDGLGLAGRLADDPGPVGRLADGIPGHRQPATYRALWL